MEQNKDTVTLIAPDGASDIAIGGVNYAVKGGEVTIPREVAHHAYAFGYTNKPLDAAAVEAEADRVRAAQSEMDKANADTIEDGGNAEVSAEEFLARDADEVIAELADLSDELLNKAEEAEIAGQAREAVVAAIEDLRKLRAAG